MFQLNKRLTCSEFSKKLDRDILNVRECLEVFGGADCWCSSIFSKQMLETVLSVNKANKLRVVFLPEDDSLVKILYQKINCTKRQCREICRMDRQQYEDFTFSNNKI